MKCLRTQDSQNEKKQKRNNYEHDIWAKQQFISHIGKRITVKQTAQHIPVGIFQSWIQFFAAFHGLVAWKTFSVDIPHISVYRGSNWYGWIENVWAPCSSSENSDSDPEFDIIRVIKVRKTPKADDAKCCTQLEAA